MPSSAKLKLKSNKVMVVRRVTRQANTKSTDTSLALTITRVVKRSFRVSKEVFSEVKDKFKN